MAQLIIKGNLVVSSALAIAEANGTANTFYFDESGNTTPGSGILEVGNTIYETYTPGDPNATPPVPESYSDVYQSGGGQNWHFAIDDAGRQLAIQVEGNVGNQGDVLDIVEVSYDSFTSDITTVDEGSPVVFTVNTTNIPDNSSVGWTITGVDTSDITGGSLTGTILITGNTGAATITPAADLFTDGGVETMTVTLDATDSNGVSTGATAIDVDINDTSLTVNQPPQLDNPTASTDSVIQNGANNDSVTIDLSQHTLDPENDSPLTWKITANVSSGTLRDTSNPNQDISTFPHTLSGSSVIYRPGNTGAPSTATFTWTAEDGISTQTNTATASIDIQVPANTAPTFPDDTLTLVANGNGNQINFTREANDDPTQTLTFEWCLQDGTTLNDINTALQHGTITPLGGVTEGWVYTQTAGLNINPGGSALTDEFWYKATDDGTPALTSNPIKITINNVAPGNNPPAWIGTPSDPTGSIIPITAGSPYEITGVEAEDPDGHTLAYTVTTSGNITATYTDGTNTLQVIGTSADPNAQVTITADDGFTGGAVGITFQFLISEQAERPLKHSAFSNSDTSACGLPRSGNLQTSSGTKFYSTGDQGTDFIENITAGTQSFIYEDSALQTPVVPVDGAFPWFAIEGFDQNGNLQVKAVELDAGDGHILQILNCSVQSGAAWPIIVNYAANEPNFCEGFIETGEAWHNIDGFNGVAGSDITLTDVANAGGQLFASEYYANQYLNNDAPTNYRLPAGFYVQPTDPATTDQNYYRNDYDGSWFAGNAGLSGQGQYLNVCPTPITYVNKSIDVYYYSPDPANISAVCTAAIGGWPAAAVNFDLITLYFRWDQANPNQNPSLLDVAKAQPLIFITANGAEAQNYTLLQPSSILLDQTTGGFVLWDNDNFSGFEGSYAWYGFDVDNTLEQIDNGSVLGGCDDGAGGDVDYVRPDLWTLTQSLPNSVDPANPIPSIQIGQETSARKSVYYAFYGCDSKLDPGVPGGEPYFPLYVVDGMVDVEEMSQEGASYINDFILAMTNGVLDVRTQIQLSSGECLTYTNYIVATNAEDAASQMQTAVDALGQTDPDPNNWTDVPARAISINAIDLGLGSQAQLTWRAMSAADQDSICYSCEIQSPGQFHDWANFTFPTIDNAEVLDRTQPSFDLEENYTLDNVSKPLLRTNPKLSTNAKIVANSSDEIFLESIDATKELASVEYKRWALNPNGDYSQDLYKFYKQSYTPADLMYTTRTDYSDFTVQDSFDKQIEEVYHYGTTYNYSKLHTEDFRMLAPIWLDKDVPKKFVIFRVNDPVGEMDFDNRGNLDNIQDILKNSEIVKTFDLTTDSSLGQYIRGHVNSESFPTTPVQFNFEKREKSSFNGIDLGKGGFTSKGEYLYKDFVYADGPLIAANAMVTDGFERNKLACANLLNLEFLFDDNQAGDYTINRYFGLYVNDVDSGYGNISSADNGNIIFKSLNSHINESPASAIPSYKQISTTPTLGYVNVSDEFYKISSRTPYDTRSLNIRVEDANNKIASEIKTAPNGNSVDIVRNDNPGFDFVKFSVIDTPAVNDRFTIFESRESVYSIKFLRHMPGEVWTLTYNDGGTITTVPNISIGNSVSATASTIEGQISGVGSNISVTSSGNEIFISEINATLGDLQISFTPNAGPNANSIAKVTQLQSSDTLFNFYASPVLEAGLFSGNSYSSQGTFADIAIAMVGCINNNPLNFDAIIEEGSSEFYVKNRVSGYRLLQSGVLVPNGNAIDFIEVSNRDLQTVNNPKGLLQLSTTVTDDNAVHYMNGGNSAAKSVLVTQDSVSDILVGDMLATKTFGLFNEVIDIVDDIETPKTKYKKLILNEKNTLESGEQKVYAENVARIGLFSAYDIHDMNFDFYDIENSELKELELETAANINYEPERSERNRLEVFGSDYAIGELDENYSYFTGINDVLPEETQDEYNESKLFSEYDRLQENNIKEFAVRSRVVPNINKWVLKDSLTVREQPYYLNANEAFGQTNFSPNFESVGRDRLGMTHEWFYMDNLPKYVTNDKLNDTFSYVNFVNGFELKPEHFKSTEYNYFDRFMVTEGFEVKNEYDIKSFIKTNLQKKYTLINGGNDVSFANTIFKGIKVDFKNRKEFVNAKANEFVKTSDFNGYKFSTLLLVRGARDNNGIEYEVIQNKKFKFVIFLITVSMDDLWIDGALNRKLLYEMNHSFVWNHEAQNFTYSDVKLQGALNLNDINFSNPNGDDYRVATGIMNSNGTSPRFLDQINPDEDNQYGKIQVTVTDSSGSVTIELGIRSVDDQGQITLSGSPQDLNGNPVNVSNIAGYVQSSAEYVYKKGGKNAFTSILDQLAVREVSELLDFNDGTIKYTTIEEDGTDLNNRFELQFNDGVEIIKNSSLITIPDEDKPKTFKLKKGIIGFNLYSADTYYPFLVRHNGNYTVDTRPVVTFTDTYSHFKTNTLQSTANTQELSIEEPLYKHSLTNAEEIKLARDYYKRYNRCGTAFNLGFITDDGSHDTGWGIIKNHFYRKVNESNASGVTKLSTSTDKLPLYPLIGEIAIDKKDVNVFRSSWDKNYYTRSLSGGLSEPVPGTFETKEERSYLGSTIMKVKDSYNIIEFTSKQVMSQEEQDLILANDNNTTDVVVFEDKKRIYIDFYITTAVNKLLSADGVLDSINKFVSAEESAGDKTTTKDDAILYVQNNLLNAFNLDMIKIYTSRIKGKYSEVLSTANVNNLDDGGFMNDTNFTFESHEQKPLNFRLIYNKRLGYSYRIRPMIKIKS